MAPGSVGGVVMVTPASTVRKKSAAAVLAAESVTLTLNWYVPALAAFPPSTPVDVSVRPSGSDEPADNVYV